MAKGEYLALKNKVTCCIYQRYEETEVLYDQIIEKIN